MKENQVGLNSRIYRERAAMLDEGKTVVWVLVADGKEAQAYLWKSHTLTPIPTFRIEAESIDDYDIEGKKLGSVFQSSSPLRHSVQPSIDIHDEIRGHFAQAILELLNQASEREMFDKFIMAAPDKLLGLLRKGLSKKTHERLIGDIPKNWTQYDKSELVQHVKDILWK